MRYRGTMVVALVAAAACSEDMPVSVTAPPPMEVDGVRAFIVREPESTPERARLTIHVDSKGLGVAAYQGRLEFDAGAFEIIEATTPQDGSRLVNATAASVRFAGFSTEGFDKTEALTLIVRPIKPLDQANLVVTLDVVGEANGTAVAKERLKVQRGLFDTSLPRIQ